ncbi:unnamed protein product [Spodoptera exigua]|nr:unnamed protein product [Spodoptera exigua]
MNKKLKLYLAKKLYVLVEEIDERCDTGKSCRQASLATKSRSEGGNTNQDRLVVDSNSQRTTRVTSAGAGTTKAASADVRGLQDQGEGVGANAVGDNVQADVAQVLVG